MRHIKMLLSILVLAVILGFCFLFEVPATLETERLMRATLPSDSVALGGPYEFGEGAGQNACWGNTVEYAIGTSLTKQQIDDYYSRQLPPDWSRYAKGISSVTWSKTDGPLVRFILIEYQPWYINPDSDTGQKLKQAGEQYTTAYFLTVSAIVCPENGP